MRYNARDQRSMHSAPQLSAKRQSVKMSTPHRRQHQQHHQQQLLTFLIILLISLINALDSAEEKPLSDWRVTPRFLHDNCACANELNCECCAEYSSRMFNITQRLCTNFSISIETLGVVVNIQLNNSTLYNNNYSLMSLPLFCYPIVPTLPLFACAKIHSLQQHVSANVYDNKLHGCVNATLTFLTYDLVNRQLGCLDFSRGGIQVHRLTNSSNYTVLI